MQRLDNFGLTDVILPFLLIFTIIYAILSLVKPLGKGDSGKSINTVVALAISLMVVVPHVTGNYPAGRDVVEIINSAIPSASAVIIAIVMGLLLLGIFGIKIVPKNSGSVSGFLILLSAIVIFYIFGNSAGWFNWGLPPALSFLNDSDVQSVVLVVAFFAIVVAFITGGNNTPGTGALQGTGDRWYKRMFDEIQKTIE